MANTEKNIIADFHLPTKLYIESDLIKNAPSIIKNYGKRVLLITTASDLELYEPEIELLQNGLERHGIGCIVYDELVNNPNTEYIDSAAYFAKKTNCDLILGFGGIDSINSAKAISLLITNYLFCDDLFDEPEIKPPITLITMPTSPLYGFELLPMFYLNEIHHLEKKCYRNNILYPAACLVDPILSQKIKDDQLAANSMSALAFATEAIISKVNNGFMNTFALKTIDLVVKHLPIAYNDSQNTNSRFQLSMASIMAGITFSISDFSASLAIALATSSRYDLPVGKIISLILPHIMEYNLTAAPGRYVQLSKVMDEDVKDITVIEAAIKAVEKVRKMEIDLDIPQRLSQLNISKNEFQKIAQITTNFNFIENAPRALTKNEIETILIAAY